MKSLSRTYEISFSFLSVLSPVQNPRFSLPFGDRQREREREQVDMLFSRLKCLQCGKHLKQIPGG